MALIIIVLLTAIAISAVAAYFSIVGLAALFAATATGVIVMATALEIGKIVTVKWIHTKWHSKRTRWWLKGYMLAAVAGLMAVTSLGIYGYLSKGHLEQNAPLAGIELQASGLERQIAQKEAENTRLEQRLDQIDKNIDSFISQDRATQGLRASERLKSERAKIQEQIDANYQSINELSDKLVPLRMESSEVEAKLGPVKYVAELFGIEDPEAAVRIVILLIMIAFDPLAICLVIAASISYDDWKEEREGATETDDLEGERLTDLRAQVKSEAESFKEDLNLIQDQIKTERDDLDIKNATLQAALAALAEKQNGVEKFATDLEDAEEALRKEWVELDAKRNEVKAAVMDLDQREKDLSDRVELLDAIFPQGRTDNEAIVDMLERNPKVLEDIIEIVDAAKRQEQASNLVVRRDPK